MEISNYVQVSYRNTDNVVNAVLSITCVTVRVIVEDCDSINTSAPCIVFVTDFYNIRFFGIVPWITFYFVFINKHPSCRMTVIGLKILKMVALLTLTVTYVRFIRKPMVTSFTKFSRALNYYLRK